MTENRRERIKKVFLDNAPVAQTAVLKQNKICSRDVAELVEDGFIKKVKTGFYAWNDDFEMLTDFEIVKGVIPHGVISVFSAAGIHEITTVNPMQICVTIPTKTLKPLLPEYPPIDLFFTSSKNLMLGVMEYQSGGTTVLIYNIERTVCDFFKYGGRIGNDMALKTLKNYMATRNKNLQRLFEYATALRVKTIIKPYVEALL